MKAISDLKLNYLIQKAKETFSPIDHNHDDIYSKTDHNHDNTYMKIGESLENLAGILPVNKGGTGCTSVAEFKNLLDAVSGNYSKFKSGAYLGKSLSTSDVINDITDVDFTPRILFIYDRQYGILNTIFFQHVGYEENTDITAASGNQLVRFEDQLTWVYINCDYSAELKQISIYQPGNLIGTERVLKVGDDGTVYMDTYDRERISTEYQLSAVFYRFASVYEYAIIG